MLVYYFVAALLAIALGYLAGSSAARRHSPTRIDPDAGRERQILRREAFILSDGQGRQRAVLRLIEDETTLLLSDEAMKWRIRLSVGADGPFIHVTEQEINSRLGIGVLPSGDVGLELADHDGTSRTLLSLAADGRSALVFKDRQGNSRATFRVSAQGDPEILLQDQNGAILTRLP